MVSANLCGEWGILPGSKNTFWRNINFLVKYYSLSTAPFKYLIKSIYIQLTIISCLYLLSFFILIVSRRITAGSRSSAFRMWPYFAFANADFFHHSALHDDQDHVALPLVEKLLALFQVKIFALVRAPDEEHLQLTGPMPSYEIIIKKQQRLLK